MDSIQRPPVKANFKDWFRVKYNCDLGEYYGPDAPRGQAAAATDPAVIGADPAAVAASSASSRKVARAVERRLRRAARAPKQPRRKSAKERRADHRAAVAARREQHGRELARVRARLIPLLVESGLTESEARYATVITRDLWVMSWHVMSCQTGAAFRFYIGRMNNKPAAAIIRRTAGEDFTQYRTRALAALGVFMVALSRATDRIGGKYNAIIQGIPREAFLVALIDPNSPDRKPPHINTLAGRARLGNETQAEQIGYLRELERAGLFYRQQLPPWDRDVKPYERAGRWTLNRYWIVAANPFQPFTDADKFRLLELVAAELDHRQADRSRLARSGRRWRDQAELDQGELDQAELDRAPPPS